MFLVPTKNINRFRSNNVVGAGVVLLDRALTVRVSQLDHLFINNVTVAGLNSLALRNGITMQLNTSLIQVDLRTYITAESHASHQLFLSSRWMYKGSEIIF